jgi:hypothetical protein
VFVCVCVCVCVCVQVMSLEQQGKQTFHLTGPGADQDPQGLFSIATETGVVSVSRSLDREASDSYQVRFFYSLLGLNLTLDLSHKSTTIAT